MSRDYAALARELYGPSDADRFLRRVDARDVEFASFIRSYSPRRFGDDDRAGERLFDHRDLFVITYGDQFRGNDAALRYLHRFLDHDLERIAGGVHILPFYPYSSDEGFSVIDYLQVNPALGSWDDIDAIGGAYRLMVDLVCNHCSVEHRWFRHFLANESPYSDYFIAASPQSDLTQVFRPRTSPLLHPFPTSTGERHIWTTFSSDQVDLNYASPALFSEMIDVLFSYIRHGARVVRLDAVAYLWKEIGTPCIHHPKTHIAVQLMRALIQERFPDVLIVTETNVAHKDNISYFGDGDNEAHMVYNFTLPPLVLDAMMRGDASHLTAWAGTLQPPSAHCTFFNFLASHDGIGLLPAYAYLSADEMSNLIEVGTARGGRVSYKQTADGAIPYELNINYLSAATDPHWSVSQKTTAFLTAQAIMCALAGVPAPYIQSVIGSENWSAGVEQGLENRAINREKYQYDAVRAELTADGSLRRSVFAGYKNLLRVRAAQRSFDPNSPQRILDLDRRLFVIRRGKLLCVHNVCSQTVRCTPDDGRTAASYTDLLTGDTIAVDSGKITVAPYRSLWLA